MTAQTGLFVHQLAGGSGTTSQGARLALAGLLAKNTDGTVKVGVLVDGLGAVVTGAAGMSYSIRKHVAVTKASEANGPTLVPNDGTVSVATDPAPGSNSRIDVIYVLQNLITGDGGSGTTNNSPELGVAKGAASATPAAPSIPTGALELARVTVPSGTTATSGLTFTQGPWTTANRSHERVGAWTANTPPGITSYPIVFDPPFPAGQVPRVTFGLRDVNLDWQSAATSSVTNTGFNIQARNGFSAALYASVDWNATLP